MAGHDPGILGHSRGPAGPGVGRKRSTIYPRRQQNKSIASASRPRRYEQFQRIAALREEYCTADRPAVRIDAKQNELIGRFRKRQSRLDEPFHLTVTLVHYPVSRSNFNSVRHRPFSEISENWSGIPLETVELILN